MVRRRSRSLKVQKSVGQLGRKKGGKGKNIIVMFGIGSWEEEEDG